MNFFPSRLHAWYLCSGRSGLGSHRFANSGVRAHTTKKLPITQDKSILFSAFVGLPTGTKQTSDKPQGTLTVMNGYNGADWNTHVFSKTYNKRACNVWCRAPCVRVEYSKKETW